MADNRDGKDSSRGEEGLISHLSELRSRLLRAIGALFVAFLALVPFSNDIYRIFALPLIAELPQGAQMIATGIVSPFIVPLKVTLLVAFCIALPYILFQVWRFVAPGLYDRERSLLLPLVASSTLLFFCGMAFAYFLVFHVVFDFIVAIAPDAVAYMPDIEHHLGFAMSLFIAFGVAFEMPVAVFVLVRSGIVEIADLRRARPYVIVGAFVIAAIFTPPDVISQLLLAIPCWLLYEVGLIIAAKFGKPREAESDPETLAKK